MRECDFKYMKEAMAADLAELLSKDFGMSVTESLDALYNSETYAKLCNPATGVVFQLVCLDGSLQFKERSKLHHFFSSARRAAPFRDACSPFVGFSSGKSVLSSRIRGITLW